MYFSGFFVLLGFNVEYECLIYLNCQVCCEVFRRKTF